MRLLISLLRILPWWAYGLIAGFLAPLVYEEALNYQSDQAEVERALAQGPPPLQKVGQYDGSPSGAPFDEVQVTGILRSDLGIGSFTTNDVSNAYFVLDSQTGDGPLVAVLFAGDTAQQDLTELIRTEQNGLITASGFQRSADSATIRGQIGQRVQFRTVLVIEGFVGPREAVLRGKLDEQLIALSVIAGAFVAAVVTAIWRFRSWRARTRARVLGSPSRPTPRRETPPTPMPSQVPPSVPTAASTAPDGPQPVSRIAKARGEMGQSPWSGGRSNVAPSKPERAAPPPAQPRQPPQPTDAALPQTPPFESVFPGGGSGFRFKTADEIINETFGSVSRLSDRTSDT